MEKKIYGLGWRQAPFGDGTVFWPAFGMNSPLPHYIPERNTRAKGKVSKEYAEWLDNRTRAKIVRDGLAKGTHRRYSHFLG